MGIRDIFKKRTRRSLQRLELTGRAATFTTFSGSAYDSDIYRAGVDAIARAAGKLRLTTWVTFADGSVAEGRHGLDRVLQVAPNPLMSSYDFLYRLVSLLYVNGNAFALVDRDDRGGVRGLYPVTYSSCEFLEDASGAIFVRFTLPNGTTTTAAYADLVHLRRHYCGNDALGERNDALQPVLQLAHAQNEGVQEAIKAGAGIRGVLRFSTLLSAEKIREQRDAFVRDYLSIQGGSGVIATDSTAEYVPLEAHPVRIDAEDTAETRRRIFSYLGLSEAIVSGDFSDMQWSAFEESVIEPLSLQISQEFTRKLLPAGAVARGWEVRCGIDRLQFISNESKISLLRELLPMGLLTVNEARAILGYEPEEDGERKIQSLNYIDQQTATEYQLARAAVLARKDGYGSAAAEPEEEQQ